MAIELETVLLMPDPKQPSGIHRLRVASYATKDPEIMICENLVTGLWVVMNEHGLFLNVLSDGRKIWETLGGLSAE